MIISNLREFYEQQIGKKILLFATCDVDSLATIKILQFLFRMDNIYNVLVPVMDYQELKEAYLQYIDNMLDHIVLVNCGATTDILHFFEQIPGETLIYIIDHQRPLSVFNIFDATNRVRVVTFLEDEEIPTADDVYADVSEDEGLESEDDDDLSLDETIRYLQVQSRRKKKQAARARRQKRMAEKTQYLYDYTQYHYFSKPSAFMMLNLAMELGQASPEVIWWTAVGVTHCFRMRRIDRYDYCKFVAFIEGEVSRIAHQNHNTRFDFKITMVNELDLLLYKNWNIWDSCFTTPSWILTFSLWTEPGQRRMKLFFAESGLAQERLRTSYPYMPMKDKLVPAIRKHGEKYNFHEWSVETFQAKYGCTFSFTAIDIQLAAMGILDANPHCTSLDVKFQDGLECLRKEGLSVLKAGMELSKNMLISVYQQVRLMLAMNLVIAYAPVLVGRFAERQFNFKYNTSTSYMKMFARFSQEAYVLQHKVRKYKHMPYVCIVPIDDEYLMVIGESPLSYDSPRTQFKRVFELTAKKMNEPDQVILNHFDPAMCQLKAEYRDEFVEKLIAVLTP